MNINQVEWVLRGLALHNLIGLVIYKVLADTAQVAIKTTIINRASSSLLIISGKEIILSAVYTLSFLQPVISALRMYLK